MLCLLVMACLQGPEQKVSDRLTPAYELLTPAGQIVQFSARPVDMAVAADGKAVWVKDRDGVRLIDFATWKEVGFAESKGGASLTGLEVRKDAPGVVFSNAGELIHVYGIKDGKVALERDITLDKTAYPCGLRFSPDGKVLYVCASMKNAIAVVDFQTGKVIRSIPVGVAPYEILLSKDGSRAFVSCQGGIAPGDKDRKEGSAGTDVKVDARGVAAGGSVSVVDLAAGKETRAISVGLLPGSMAWANDDLLIVANANQDSVSFVDAKAGRTISTLTIRPDSKLPFGSMPNGLALTPDRKRLFVALAGNNAVAQVDISDPRRARIEGFIPTAWYPGALAVHQGALLVANVKGFGSVAKKRPEAQGGNSWDNTGVVQKVPLPDASGLAAHSKKVIENARVKPILAELERQQRPSAKAVPVPAKLGDPSVFQHVIYVIKENRTYDQVFGDMERGDGDKRLCTFGEKITPNHHAIARDFVLLDNYYCSGVCSADGHTWAVEGNVTPYLERQFGGFTRTYDYGTDPLTYSSSGMIWDSILAKGLSFRNFGCEVYPSLPKGWKLDRIWRNYQAGPDAVFPNSIELERLTAYTSPDFPGWEMAIPDVLRMDRFLKEFRQWEASGTMPNFVMVYLPQDHTAGTSPGYPSVPSYVADNDLAVGRLVEAVSKSKFWASTVIIANEDDPQNGFDHVDGHRSICLVASPYSKRGKTVSKFYNQSSVLHTILRIFGLPAMNQKIASAPLMTDCFGSTPDMRPYEAVNPQVDLDKLNPSLASLKGNALRWAKASQALRFDKPDFSSLEKDSLMNRIIWFAMKGDTPYPSRYEGSHGKGLKTRGLKIEKGVPEDD